MANVTTLLKYSLKTNVVKSIYFEIISKVSQYYYTFGRSKPWPTVTATDPITNVQYTVSSDDDPPAVSDSYPFELSVRNNMQSAKYIDSNDAAIVVDRHDWFVGRIYDQYDDYSADLPSYTGAISIDTATFYVITDQFNVYKCLYNNNNAQSLVKPTGTNPTSFITSDGYVWKFMYTIPLSLRNKFISSRYIPVLTSLSDQFYSRGSINSFLIENKGKGYISSTWKVSEVIVLNGGSGYTVGGTVLRFDAAPTGGTRATAVVTSVDSNGAITAVNVTNVGNKYKIQPQLDVISSPVGAAGASFLVLYEKNYTTGYTELKITGDGYNKNNPYSIKSVNIVNRGVFSALPSGDLVAFPSTKKLYGRQADIDITFRERVGFAGTYEIDEVTVLSKGFGYDAPLVFGQNVLSPQLTAAGAILDFNTATQKNEAEIIPFLNANGEIVSIQITEAGIGYTYANVTAICYKNIDGAYVPTQEGLSISDPRYVAGFKTASIKLNFGVGTIDSKQSNVELLAVDGSIEVINVDNGGTGYSSTTELQVIGDGTGCVCQPVVKNGKITRVIVTNIGKNYKSATVVAVGGGAGAILRPIISPKGGHGKDTVSELYAKTIMLVTSLSAESNQGIPISNDYRQVAILKNPTEYANETFYKRTIASTCALLEADVTAVNTIAYNAIALDDELAYSSDPSKLFTVVEKANVGDKYYLVVTLDSNFLPVVGSTVTKTSGQNVYTFNISSVEAPDIDKYSGEMLYIDNRLKFTSNAEQAVVVSTLITF